MANKICSICGCKVSGFGNSSWPVTKGEDDVCCEICNLTQVIPARILGLYKKQEVQNEQNA